MTTVNNQTITIQATVQAPVEKVWEVWTNTDEIVKWSSPSPDWYTPRAEHELKPGGRFTYRMEARDGSMGFDFGGVFDVIKPNEYIEYTIGDGRKVSIHFENRGGATHIRETFEAESINSIEQQRSGWQAILDNFKAYTEKSN